MLVAIDRRSTGDLAQPRSKSRRSTRHERKASCSSAASATERLCSKAPPDESRPPRLVAIQLRMGLWARSASLWKQIPYVKCGARSCGRAAPGRLSRSGRRDEGNGRKDASIGLRRAACARLFHGDRERLGIDAIQLVASLDL